MSFHLAPRIRLEACAASLCLLAACTFPEAAPRPPEPRPETCPAAEPLPAPAPPAEPAPEFVPLDNCLGCGRGFVSARSKHVLDAYSEQSKS